MIRLCWMLPLLLLCSCSGLKDLWGNMGSIHIVGKDKPETAEQIFEPHEDLQLRWMVDLDQRRPGSVGGFSIPLVLHREGGDVVIAGAADKRVRIYDAVNGKELKRIALQAPCESGAVQLANGLVVLGDVRGMIYAVDPEAGLIRWRQQLSSMIQGRPVFASGVVLVQTANNRVYAFSQDGKKLWSYSGPSSGLGMRAGPSPLVHGSQVYVVLNQGDVIALKLESGDLLWKRQLLLSNDAAVFGELQIPVADPVLIPAEQTGSFEDVIAVAMYQGDLILLSGVDGREIARRKLSLKHAPVLVQHILYAADSSGNLLALETRSARTLWKRKLSRGELAGPVFAQQSLWLGDETGEVFRVSLDGRLLASRTLPGRIERAPVPLGQGVLVRSNLGVLYALQ